MDIDLLDAINSSKKRISLPDGRTLDVTIPEGIADGQTLRLKGKGMPGLGAGEPGDALITVRIRPHKTFKRLGNDILVDLPISLAEAVLGGPVEVPTVSGQVKMTVPKGSSSGAVLRLKGKGVRTKSGAGDQLVTLKVMLPDQIDPDLEAFIKSWSETHAYDPRKTTTEAA